MAFNPKHHLAANLEAIRLAFELQREKRTPTARETEMLRQYAGFGGIKAVLNSPGDDAFWQSQTDRELRPLVLNLHQLLHDHTGPQGAEESLSSLRRSVLTGFYTPPQLIDAIASTLRDEGIAVQSVLDPSAGTGQFLDGLRRQGHEPGEVLLFEKDLLTGLVLTALHGREQTRVEPFEEIAARHAGTFDLVTSNIPFGTFRCSMSATPTEKISSNGRLAGRYIPIFLSRPSTRRAKGAWWPSSRRTAC